MASFFAKNYQGAPFQAFGLSHFAALGAITLVCLALILWGQRPGAGTRRALRYGLAALLLTTGISWIAWRLITGAFAVQLDLPLQLCTAMVFISAGMLVSASLSTTKSYRVYELVYFLGIGGAIQALLTPDIGPYGFPHYGYFHFFIGHGSTIAAATYMTAVEGYRPHWKSLWRAIVAINLYMLVLFPINLWLHADYMFLMWKPSAPSLLDYLGPWPWYVLAAEPIGVTVFLLLYLPFLLRDRRQSRAPAHA
jgi:hypothetical integral membrane protein (TIGR02206 family)